MAFCSFGHSYPLLTLCTTHIICSRTKKMTFKGMNTAATEIIYILCNFNVNVHTICCLSSSAYRCGDTCTPLSSVHWKHFCCVGEGVASSQDKTLLNCFLILINIAYSLLKPIVLCLLSICS